MSTVTSDMVSDGDEYCYVDMMSDGDEYFYYLRYGE